MVATDAGPCHPSYAELYDPVLQAFSPVAGLTISQAGYTATLLNNGIVLIVAGKTPVANQSQMSTWLIPPLAQSRQTAALAPRALGTPPHSLAMAV